MKINYAKETLSLNVEDIESVIVDDVTKLNNAIANIKGSKKMTPVEIILKGGTYSLSQTLDLSNIVRPVIFKSFNTNEVIIDGLGNVNPNFHCFTLYQGENEKKICEYTDFTNRYRLIRNGNVVSITDKSGVIPQDFTGYLQKNSYLYFYTKWVAMRMRVTDIGINGITVESESFNTMLYNDEGFIRIVNCIFDKRKNGDYFISSETNTTTYKDSSGNTLSGNIRVGNLYTLVRIKNCANITFENITFRDNGIEKSKLITKSGEQAEINYMAPTAAVEIINSTNIKISKCKFRDLYGYCVGIDDNCSRIQITGNTINGTYGGGIQILNNCCYNCIENNTIANFGEYQPGSVGIIVTESHHNRITNNHIYNGDYTGISLGWTWGYGESHCFANYVARNHIHHCMRMKLNDGGGIYTLGKSPGTVIENNVIHDIVSWVKYDSTGIYFDEGSSDIVARSNVIYGCHVGVHQHYGYNNELDNNLFINLDYAALRFSKAEPHLSLYAHNNIFVLNKNEGVFIRKLFQPSYELTNNLIDDTRGNSYDIIEEDIYNHDFYLESVNFSIKDDGDWDISAGSNSNKFIIRDENLEGEELQKEREKKVYHFLVPIKKNIGVKNTEDSSDSQE